MIPFDLAEPTSLSAAIKLLNPDDPTIRPIAGGTALMLMMKAGVFNPEKLVSLRKIEKKYSSIVAAADGLRIGAMTTLNTIEAKIEGTPLGVVGRLTATSRTHLTEADGQTVIAYSIDSTLAGKLGSIGQPVLRAKAKDMEKQFAARLRAAFAEGHPEAQ